MLVASSLQVKWCQKNLKHFSQAVYDVFSESYPDVPMEVSECLDVCGLCTDVPFAFRNGAIVSARDALGLYKKLENGMSFLTEEPLPGTYTFLVSKLKSEEVFSDDLLEQSDDDASVSTLSAK
jgi:uncharacterized protein YuzB (UPF0349 family)